MLFINSEILTDIGPSSLNSSYPTFAISPKIGEIPLAKSPNTFAAASALFFIESITLLIMSRTLFIFANIGIYFSICSLSNSFAFPPFLVPSVNSL